MKMLIVEDDVNLGLILQKYLESYGAADIVVNGKQAVDITTAALAGGSPYDLIFLDIMMPEMDGQEALWQIRAQEEAWGVIPKNRAMIVMTTALDDSRNVRHAFSLCDAYLIKPIQNAKLIETLRSLKLIP